MEVVRKNNEILIRFSTRAKASKIQSILDYLRYEELTSNSQGTEEDVDKLINEARIDRWNKIKEEIGLDKKN